MKINFLLVVTEIGNLSMFNHYNNRSLLIPALPSGPNFFKNHFLKKGEKVWFNYFISSTFAADSQ